MTAIICTLMGVAGGAFSVWIIHYGNVGTYRVGEGDERSGWVHDGTLYVAESGAAPDEGGEA